MNHSTLVVAALALALGGTSSSDPAVSVTGDYVEARTAEVFTGACMLGNEADTLGREAIMAWRVSRGAVDGVSVDGLSVVAVVAADRNLGMHELGAERPAVVKTVVMVDERATQAQRDALVQVARSLCPLVRDVVEVNPVPIAFTREHDDVRVSAGEARLDVTTTFDHSPVCGALQWFSPLASTATSAVGLARTNSWSGKALDAQWSQADRKSSFVGTFTLSR
jgi:hypothetical protein